MRHDHFVFQFARQSAHPGECICVSQPMRQRGMLPSASSIAFDGCGRTPLASRSYKFLVQRIQLSATPAFLSCLLLMPLLMHLPYGLENRLEEAAVFA
jgi:hypothetical protein